MNIYRISFYIIIGFYLCNAQACHYSTPPLSNTKDSDILNNYIFGIGRIETENPMIHLSNSQGGIVQQIFYHEGDTIPQGACVATLSNHIEQADVTIALNDIITQKKQLVIDSATWQESVAQLNYKKENYEIALSLFNKKSETQEHVNDMKIQVVSETDVVEKNKAILALDQQKIMVAYANYEKAKQALLLRNIYAPDTGILIKLDEFKGDALPPLQSLGSFAPISRKIANCEIDELFAHKIKLYQKAWITELGSNQPIDSGYIIFASDNLKQKSLFIENAGEAEDRRVREVHILLSPHSWLLLGHRIQCVVQ